MAGLAYLAVPLPYNALALGRWGALVVYAGAPWVLAILARSTGLEPFVRRAGVPTGSGGAGDGTADPGGAWASRHGLLGGSLALGVLEAVLISFVPAAAIVVVLVALCLVLSSLLFADAARDGAVRPAGPGLDRRGRGHLASRGSSGCSRRAGACSPCSAWARPTSGAATWGTLLRFAAGPIGGSPLTWGFVVAAAAPLVLARGVRFRWAARFWAIALVFWFVAWISGRGWTGGLAVDPLVLLGPAAAATSASIGLGVAAFERDLPKAEFGWRQVVTVVGVLAVALAIGARPWSRPCPGDGTCRPTTSPSRWRGCRPRWPDGPFRVLWLGDPRSLNQGGWNAGDGLAYATSENGSPDARWLWNGTAPGPAARLGSAVDLARNDRTDRLGSLLAPAAVRYVVVLTSIAPEIAGEQSPTAYPVPADLMPALGRQLDLQPVLSGTGITVYANAAWVPQRAEVPGRPGSALPVASPLAAAPGTPVVPGATARAPGGPGLPVVPRPAGRRHPVLVGRPLG